MSKCIKVDYRKLENAAKTMDEYVDNHKFNMGKANQEVAALATAWQGQDSAQFQIQWGGLTEKGSTSEQMIAAMENYAKLIRAAARKYMDAQTRASSRAIRIPR